MKYIYIYKLHNIETICVCIYYTYIYIYIYIYTHTHTHTLHNIETLYIYLYIYTLHIIEKLYIYIYIYIYTFHSIETRLNGSIYLFFADKVYCRKIYHFRRIELRSPFLSVPFNRFFSNKSFDLWLGLYITTSLNFL